jgi:hypothetical protein
MPNSVRVIAATKIPEVILDEATIRLLRRRDMMANGLVILGVTSYLLAAFETSTARAVGFGAVGLASSLSASWIYTKDWRARILLRRMERRALSNPTPTSIKPRK